MHCWYTTRKTSIYRFPLILLLLILLSSLTANYTLASHSSSSSLVLPHLPVTGEFIGHNASINHLPPPLTDSWNTRNRLPSLFQFTSDIENGEAHSIRGVYVPGFLALPVVQQPSGNLGFVSQRPNAVTQFQLAARYDVIGLLAHNYLSGKEFYRLFEDLRVIIIRGDRSIDLYQITGVYRLQKLSPGSNWSHYINLDSGERLTTYQVFEQFYQGEHHLTLQTCLEKDGLETWGLLFVVAEPLS